jgi:hypothetical protein
MNLEQIRAWKNRIQADWDAIDRSQKRSAEIPERLHWLENWEGTVKNSIRKTNETPDSPKKFQTFYEAAKEQERLAEEIAVFQNEFQQNLNGNDGSEQDRRGTEAILQEFGHLHDLTGSIAESLRHFQGEKAAEVADETAHRINRLRLNLSPFEVIVQEAEKKQAMLCNVNPVSGETESSSLDMPEQVREEQLVADWMPLMVFRAKQGLQAMESGESTDQSHHPENAEALRKSMDLAVQYGQEIQTLAEDAFRRLSENQAEEALPKQKQALERFSEILEPLQQNQQQQQNKDQDQQQNQNQQGQNQQNNPNQQQSQDSEQKQEQQQDENSSSDKQPEAKPSEQKPEPKDLTPQEKNEETEKAERMLRQVKRRQQEANERRERVRVLLMQAAPVEKDW